jgi:hypothetical protein
MNERAAQLIFGTHHCPPGEQAGRRGVFGRGGFSLTELVVVMGIFMTIMLITSNTFKIIANQASQQSKSVETQIEGIVGLEVLRADLTQAGFGLCETFQNTPASYNEANMDSNMPTNFWTGTDSPQTFNDPPDAPRAIQSRETTFNEADGHGSKYIVIKSTAVATNNASKKWTNVSYASGMRTTREWHDTSRDFAASDRVIVVKNNLVTTPASRQLMVRPATAATNPGSYSTTFDNYTTLIQPHVDGDTFQIYGVSSGNLRMPFNRADYFIMKPTTNMPAGCAPKTGVLYKYNISHSTGGFDPKIPLLDCVADMQIVYGLDGSASGSINQYLDAPANTLSKTAADIRAQLKEIRVYILAQDGQKDLTYTYPSEKVKVGETLNGVFRGREFDLKNIIITDWDHYRWKVYTIVVRPQNLIQ